MAKEYKIMHKISFGFAVTLGYALLIGGSALYTLCMMKEKVSYGNRSVEKAVESFERITDVINKINLEMEQIKTSSHYQTSEIENILSELSEVEIVVQNAAAGAEETAQISGFLNEQAISDLKNP